jgi:hypothetical protein
MVFLRNVKLCKASILYWCQWLNLYICFALNVLNWVENGSLTQSPPAVDLGYGPRHQEDICRLRDSQGLSGGGGRVKVLCTRTYLFAPYSLLLISNKFWMGRGEGRWGVALRACCTAVNWTDHLPWVLLCLCSTAREDGNTTPAQAVFSSPLIFPGQFFWILLNFLQNNSLSNFLEH